MTGIGWAALTFTAAVAGLALLLAVALAGRLRRLEALFAEPHVDPELPRPGEPLPDVPMTDTSGAPVDAGTGDVLLAFLTTECDACRSMASALRDEPGVRSIAVVIGPAVERSAMVDALVPRMPVVEQPDHNGLAARFGVRAFPSVLLVNDGVVTAAGHDLSDVRPKMRAGRPA